MNLQAAVMALDFPNISSQGDPTLGLARSDSRSISPGDLFVCMSGSEVENRKHIVDASARGAGAIFVRTGPDLEFCKENQLAYICLDGSEMDFRLAIGAVSHLLAGNPSRHLKVVGITGTNGKTTTAWIMRSLLNKCMGASACFGTLGYLDSRSSFENRNTTPVAPEIAEAMQLAVLHYQDCFVMEVSSHALVEERIAGVEFDGAVFTNLTQDHLDYHQDMTNYELAKKRLFKEVPNRSSKHFTAALNLDDPVGLKWYQELDLPKIGYSTTSLFEDCLFVESNYAGLTELDLNVFYNEVEMLNLVVNIGGQYNVSNVASAIAGCLALGVELESIVKSLSEVTPVPGRFEPIANSLGFEVIIDYAHTPNALLKLLKSVRELTTGKLICVFGCGGDRDKSKRPLMAEVVSGLADLTIITSDNPRTEDPSVIIKETELGIREGTESISILDRKEAIYFAINKACPLDVVVIAGKGHEGYQVIGTTSYPSDDRILAREVLTVREAAFR